MDIILLKVNEKLTWEELSGFMGCLGAAQKAAVNKKAKEGDKINALLSRLLVTSEIERRTGIKAHRIKFGHGSFGKPFIQDSELRFSMSHTHGAICAAFGGEGEIGVDVELRSRRVNEELYKRVLCKEERLHTTSNEDFLRFWVKKEAFLKRLGVGITRDLRGINSPELPDTAVIERGELFIGVSGKGALNASVTEISLDELLDRFTLKL